MTVLWMGATVVAHPSRATMPGDSLPQLVLVFGLTTTLLAKPHTAGLSMVFIGFQCFSMVFDVFQLF